MGVSCKIWKWLCPLYPPDFWFMSWTQLHKLSCGTPCCRMTVNAKGYEESGVCRREINLGHEKPGDFRLACPSLRKLRPRSKVLACPTRQ